MNNQERKNEIIFEASPEVFGYVQQLWKSGELSKMLGVSALDITVYPNFSQRLHEITNLAWLSWQEIKEQLKDIFVLPQLSFRHHDISKEISTLTNIIYATQEKEEKIICIKNLGELGANNYQVIELLTQILESNPETDIFWETAISLEKVQPNHPQAAKRLAKLVILKTTDEEYPFIINLNTVSKPENRIGILVRVFCADEQELLPCSLKLAIVSPTGESKKEVQVTCDEQSQSISILQISFSASKPSKFTVKLTLGTAEIVENIAVE